jgi:hypothetical protein
MRSFATMRIIDAARNLVNASIAARYSFVT